ncbi:MAG: 2OG-Fe(II) oxygenase [Alphaproteobacteria bacterium]|nr:2OG-Fe(II) oxygenase [Alphaproteobacteria bacterium]
MSDLATPYHALAAAQAAIAAGDPIMAGQHLIRSLTAHGHTAEVYDLLSQLVLAAHADGVAALNASDPVTAEAAFRRAIAIHPYDPQAYRDLTALYFAQHRQADLSTIGESPYTADLYGNDVQPVVGVEQGLVIIKNAISAEAVARLRIGLTPNPDFLPTAFLSDTGEKVIGVDERERKAQMAELFHVAGFVNGTIRRLFEQFAQPVYNVWPDYWEWPVCLHYEAGGHYLPHADADHPDSTGEWQRVQDRDLSLLIYLNDEFEGGDLVFVNQGLQFRPSPGTAVIFPSDHRFVHGVVPVRSGVRQSIVTWMKAEGTVQLHGSPNLRVPRFAYRPR